MKILADENISRLLVERLRQEGHEVPYIMEIARGSNDPTVLELASQQGALLVTDDKDFGELVFHQHLHASRCTYPPCLAMWGVSHCHQRHTTI